MQHPTSPDRTADPAARHRQPRRARPPVRRFRRPQAAFTLIELVATLAVGAVLTLVAAPVLSYATNSARVSGEINALLGDLDYARIEAVKEGSTVSACASGNGSTCNGTANWAAGWIVWSDVNGNHQVDPGEPVRTVHPALTGGDTLVASSGNALSFNRDGFATGVSAGALFALHDATTNQVWTRCLIVSRTGSLATSTYSVGTCT